MTYSCTRVARRRLPWTVAILGCRSFASPLSCRAFTLSASRSTSLADHIKNAISAFTPKDMRGSDAPRIERIRGKRNSVFTITHGFTKTSTEMPKHLRDLIAQINNPSDRLLALIRSEEVPARVLLIVYQPIMGMLTDQCVLEFAYTLYSASLYSDCLSIITQNMALNDTLTLIADGLIPRICDEGIDFPDFAIATFVRLFLQANNASMATQLSQLLNESSRFPRVKFENILEEVEVQLKLELAQNGREVLELLQEASSFPSHDKLSLYIQDDALNLVTRTAIIKSLIAEEINIKEFTTLAIPLISKPGVLRNLTRDITNENGIGSIEHINLLDFVCHILETTHLRFHRNDLTSIPKVALSKQDFRRLWKAFSYYLESNQSRTRKDSGNVRYKRSALIEFLKLSVELNDPQHAVEITTVLSALNQRLDNVELATRVIFSVFWCTRAPPTRNSNHDWELSGQTQDNSENPESYEHTKDTHETFTEHLLDKTHEPKLHFIDEKMVTDLLVNLSKTIPRKVFTTALAQALWRSNSRYNLKRLQHIGKGLMPTPGELLTPFSSSLLHSVFDAFKFIYPKLPAEIERPLAIAVATQPMISQLSYFAMPAVSAEGIVGVLGCYAAVLRFAELAKAEVHQRDCAMLVVIGLVILSYKRAGRTFNTNFTSVEDLTASFEQIVASSDDTTSIDTQSLIAVFSEFVKRDQYLVALNAADLISKNALFNSKAPPPLDHQLPLRVYFDLMIRAAMHAPELAWEVYEWLKMRYRAPVPAIVLRRMGCGFAQSPHLSASLSTKLVTNVHRILRGRDEPIGPELAIALVNSIIRRGRESGTGSFARLKWAMDVARAENVSDDQFRAWLAELSDLDFRGSAFWKKRPEHYQHR